MADLCNLSTALIFGTDTGNTEEVGDKIAAELAPFGCPVEMIDVNEASADVLEAYDFLILGIPTWDFGGIQEDWENFENELAEADLSNAVVALYGLGDQFGYGDYFVDAMGWIHERIHNKVAALVGKWGTEGYEFNDSRALLEDGKTFCGLAVDEDQQFELTDQRVETWVQQIAAEIELIDVLA